MDGLETTFLLGHGLFQLRLLLVSGSVILKEKPMFWNHRHPGLPQICSNPLTSDFLRKTDVLLPTDVIKHQEMYKPMPMTDPWDDCTFPYKKKHTNSTIPVGTYIPFPSVMPSRSRYGSRKSTPWRNQGEASAWCLWKKPKSRWVLLLMEEIINLKSGGRKPHRIWMVLNACFFPCKSQGIT